jgi:hypothetical protein
LQPQLILFSVTAVGVFDRRQVPESYSFPAESVTIFSNRQPLIMRIELQAPKGQVKEWILNLLKRKLIDLHIMHPEIASAQVRMRDANKTQKSVSIDLTIKGASVFFNQSASSFEKACMFVLVEVEKKLKHLIPHMNVIAAKRLRTI